jgi:adenosylhomocysteine nucleosidase
LNAIIAALPREVAALVRGVAPDPHRKRDGVFLYRLPNAVVVCGGMGSVRVLLAVRAALDSGEIDTLISTGLAGGCDPAAQVGTVFEARTIVDAQSGARFTTSSGDATLVTTHSIASIHEKQRLFASYGAAVVDMEAATVARMAETHGLRFRAIKAVSDAHDFELSSLSRFATHHGHFRTGAFALHTALRPHSWRKTMQLGSGSQRALRALTETLKEVLA